MTNLEDCLDEDKAAPKKEKMFDVDLVSDTKLHPYNCLNVLNCFIAFEMYTNDKFFVESNEELSSKNLLKIRFNNSYGVCEKHTITYKEEMTPTQLLDAIFDIFTSKADIQNSVRDILNKPFYYDNDVAALIKEIYSVISSITYYDSGAFNELVETVTAICNRTNVDFVLNSKARCKKSGRSTN